MFRQFTIAVISVFMLVSTAAAELPGTMNIGEQELQLNGEGLRTKFFFKVYNGGLYLQEAGQNDPTQIIQADEPMAIRMQWLRDVPGDKIIEGWNSGFNHSLDGDTTPLQDDIDHFNSIFEKGAKKDQIHDIVYLPENGILVYEDGKLAQQIGGKDFKEAVFGIWLGENTEVPDVREAMLGQK